MTPSDREALTADTKLAEGFRARPYLDTKGVLTVAYGQRVDELVVSEATGSLWLTKRLSQAEDEAEMFPWYRTLTGNRHRAVVEMLYNLGRTRFLTFKKMIAALGRGDYESAADEATDSKWYLDVGPTRGDRIAGLLRHG